MSKKHVYSFNEFLREQAEVDAADTGAPIEGGDPAAAADAALGAGGDQQQQAPPPKRIYFAFLDATRDGRPKYREETKEFPYYSVGEDKIRAWAEKKVDDNKIEDFMRMIVQKEKIDTLDEKKYIHSLYKAVKARDVGQFEGHFDVEFNDKGEAFTDALEITFLYVQ